MAYIQALDNIMFFKNMAGSNSLRIGDGENPAILTDDGTVGGNQGRFQSVYSFGEITGNSLKSNTTLQTLEDIFCYGNVHCRDVIRDGGASRAEWKTDIKKFDKSGLDIVDNTDIYEYRLKKDEKDHKKRIGFVIGDDYNYTHEITMEDENHKEIGVDDYSMNSVSFKAIQELHQMVKEQQQIIDKLNKRVENLENKLKEEK